MRILLTLKRQGGSHVEIDGIHYHFKPDTRDNHVATVTDKAHIRRLLQIDGYEVFEGDEAAAAAAATPDPDLVPLTAGDSAGEDAGDDEAEDADNLPVIEAASAMPIAPEGPGRQPDPVNLPNYDAMADADLSAAFVAKYGRAPHAKASRKKLIERLIDHDLAHAGATGAP